MNIVQYTCIKYSALHNLCECGSTLLLLVQIKERERERVDHYYNHVSYITMMSSQSHNVYVKEFNINKNN